ncbi:hypothetical protein BK139_17775 [Paenibacillus sp. FSL R5-0490]|nr:hypothetical protein BK139_17775 [Paenibacillus sp. FSL R5-0490]
MMEKILIMNALLFSVIIVFLLYKNKSKHNNISIIVVLLILLSGVFSVTAYLIKSNYSIILYNLQWISLLVAVILQFRIKNSKEKLHK